jgi:hypothetical protein
MKLFMSFTSIMRLAKLILKNCRSSWYPFISGYQSYSHSSWPVGSLMREYSFCTQKEKQTQAAHCTISRVIDAPVKFMESANELRTDKILNSINDITQ